MMHKQYALITPDLYTGSMRKVGPYVLADLPWLLSHANRDGFLEVTARVLADEIGGDLKEHQMAIEWLGQQGELVRIGRYAYCLPNYGRYKLQWQAIRRREYGRFWDRGTRPSGTQAAKERKSRKTEQERG